MIYLLIVEWCNYIEKNKALYKEVLWSTTCKTFDASWKVIFIFEMPKILLNIKLFSNSLLWNLNIINLESDSMIYNTEKINSRFD